MVGCDGRVERHRGGQRRYKKGGLQAGARSRRAIRSGAQAGSGRCRAGGAKLATKGLKLRKGGRGRVKIWSGSSNAC